jgi:uncharacterized protein
MTKAEVIAKLRARESELRAMGIERLSLFGSVARGEEGAGSDVDLAVRFAAPARETLGVFEFLEVRESIADLLGTSVDLVTEPARKPRFQAEIERERVRVF